MQSDLENQEDESICLNIELIHSDYIQFRTQPQAYLMAVIKEENPWNHSQGHIRSFLRAIGKTYNPIPYHNVTHAFDVMTAIDQYLCRYGWKDRLNINTTKRIYMLLAAYAHDSGHNGLTNAYYKNSKHLLSIDTQSPLQTMHASNLRRLLREYDIEIKMQDLEQMTEMILKTDNFYHGWLIKKIKQLKQMSKQQLTQTSHLLQLKCILLHTADLNNTTKDVQMNMKWTNLLYQQFQNQRLLEQKEGLPLFQRRIETQLQHIESNLCFLNFMIIPLFRGVSQLEPKCQILYERVLKNQQYWVQQQSKETKKHFSVSL